MVVAGLRDNPDRVRRAQAENHSTTSTPATAATVEKAVTAAPAAAEPAGSPSESSGKARPHPRSRTRRPPQAKQAPRASAACPAPMTASPGSSKSCFKRRECAMRRPFGKPQQRRGLWVLGGLATMAAVMSCTDPFHTCRETRTCAPPPENGDAGDAGTANGGNAGANSAGGTGGNASTGGTAGSLSGSAGEAGAGGGGITCDTSKDPSVEACLVDDDYAVFVAPGGKDNAAGTKSAPLATLSKAVEIAAGVRLVLVCDASFDEHVTVSRGARIYGGFRGADWSSEDGAPLFKPTTPGPALKVDGVTASLSFTRLHFEVGDATNSGETALTAIVNASSEVTFDEVSLKAGKGKAGAAGTLTAFTFPDPSALNGNAETAPGVGGGGKAC